MLGAFVAALSGRERVALDERGRALPWALLGLRKGVLYFRRGNRHIGVSSEGAGVTEFGVALVREKVQPLRCRPASESVSVENSVGF